MELYFLTYTYFHAMNTTTLRGLRTACRYQRIQSGISPRISSYSSRSPSIQSTTFLLFRYASTTTTSSNKETTSSKQHPVNGPLTTLPAPLQTPTRQPSQSLPGYLFALGKSYVAFYKTGIKNIYTNYKASQPLQSTIDKNHSSSLAAAVKAGSLTRSEFQLLARNWHDVKRVPMFRFGVACLWGVYAVGGYCSDEYCALDV